ncbi:MAG: hypothetical protein L0220_28250, partial [Acidobacteria bacterium]|nr:hypothetical protein [Acidobacteriota bacterium]
NPSALYRGDRICRFWKSKTTDRIVEVRRALRDVDRNQFRVVIFDPDIGQELNLPYEDVPHPFQPPGAPEILMEKGLKTLYTPYGNFSSRA